MWNWEKQVPAVCWIVSQIVLVPPQCHESHKIHPLTTITVKMRVEKVVQLLPLIGLNLVLPLFPARWIPSCGRPSQTLWSTWKRSWRTLKWRSCGTRACPSALTPTRRPRPMGTVKVWCHHVAFQLRCLLKRHELSHLRNKMNPFTQFHPASLSTLETYSALPPLDTSPAFVTATLHPLCECGNVEQFG